MAIAITISINVKPSGRRIGQNVTRLAANHNRRRRPPSSRLARALFITLESAPVQDRTTAVQ
jgi:hypothetical protein